MSSRHSTRIRRLTLWQPARTAAAERDQGMLFSFPCVPGAQRQYWNIPVYFTTWRDMRDWWSPAEPSHMCACLTHSPCVRASCLQSKKISKYRFPSPSVPNFRLFQRVVLAVETFPPGRSIAVARCDGSWRRIWRQRRKLVELDCSGPLGGRSARTLGDSGEAGNMWNWRAFVEAGRPVNCET